MSLSLRMMSRLLGVSLTLLSPSKASPPLIAPSPMTATTCLSVSPRCIVATLMPRAAEMELEAWPQAKVSYSLSEGEGKGRTPPQQRLVWNVSRRPAKILCP